MKTQLKLVVVEDSIADAELLARHLAKSGVNCVIDRVQTEPDFIAALHRVKPDLILSDFSLPNFGGLRALDLAQHADALLIGCSELSIISSGITIPFVDSLDVQAQAIVNFAIPSG